MDKRIAELAEALLLVERALRVNDLWQSRQPTIEELSSPEPFSVDRLAFEEWLQWIFLPRMKILIETGQPLPTRSGIHAMAEIRFGEAGGSAGELLEVLAGLDALLLAGDQS